MTTQLERVIYRQTLEPDCEHEWHTPDQVVDDMHYCTRPEGHTGPHACGWCEGIARDT